MNHDRTVGSAEADEHASTEQLAEQYDRRAEEFLELEDALSSVDGAESLFGEENEAGMVVDASRVSLDAVPQTYPDRISTSDALALTVSLDTDRTVTVYIEWPDNFTTESPLVRLLASLDLHPSRFADLQGEEVPLKRVSGTYVLDLAAAPPKTGRSSRWVWGVAAGVTAWTGIWLFMDQIDLIIDVGGVIIITWLLLPALIYFDLMYVRTVSAWKPNRIIWPLLAAIWLINIPAGLSYLYKRVQTLGPFWK
jgi:hypothetical protein